jgi:NEDD4-binding protein 2
MRSRALLLLLAVCTSFPLLSQARTVRWTERLNLKGGARCKLYMRRASGTSGEPYRIVVRTRSGKVIRWDLDSDRMTRRWPRRHGGTGKTTAAPERVMYLLRGISGSGKSTLARSVVKGGVVLAGDDYFMKDGQYVHSVAKLPESKRWNRRRAVRALDRGTSPVIIDNTHTRAFEMTPYVQAALKRGYKVRILESNTPWRFDAEVLARRNTHGTPLRVIRDMINRYEHDLNVADILRARQPR